MICFFHRNPPERGIFLISDREGCIVKNHATERLLLVDGSNLLFQMFYGMPARIVNRDGKAIQGTLGFVGALLKIIRRTEPSHLAVIFDGEHENSRAALDPEYKANRPDYSQIPDEDNPFSQLPDIYAALDHLGIAHTETTDCEADDVLAAYALACGSDMEIVLCSQDSDLFQLITEHVSVLRYRGEKTVLCTPDTILEKFGITPAQYADFKSLTGDPSDHIRGAEKVGPKTAAALLRQFGTLEEILLHTEEIQKPSVRDSLCRSRERLLLNQKLIRLTGTTALPFPIPALQFHCPECTTSDVLRAIGLR